MKRMAVPIIVCTTAVLCVMGFSSLLHAQPPGASGRAQKSPVQPRQPKRLTLNSRMTVH